MNLVFNEDSLAWLKQTGFTDDDVVDAQKVLSIAAKNMTSEASFRLPAGTTLKVAALAYAVILTMDDETIIGNLLALSEEARDAFNEEMEIGELEQVSVKLSKIKMGKRYSDARRKSSVKKGGSSMY